MQRRKLRKTNRFKDISIKIIKLKIYINYDKNIEDLVKNKKYCFLE
jgi:hypothetical protein